MLIVLQMRDQKQIIKVNNNNYDSDLLIVYGYLYVHNNTLISVF